MNKALMIASMFGLASTFLSLGTVAAATELSQRDKAMALIRSIETGEPGPVSYINPGKYIQHNLAVADGLSGFAQVMQQLPKGSARAKVIRAFEDGDYAFTHTEYDFFGPKIGFDIFRFENGLIVEHWDNLQDVASANPSGRSQTDGTVEITDQELTEENKALVAGLITDVFLGAAPEKITEYISTTSYLQHNPGVADGLDALGEALAAMAQAGTPMTYSKNHLILGEGNFVLAVSEGHFLGKQVAFYDLFRIEAGKVVEHWDTIEAIPGKTVWKNENGKF